MCIRDRLSRDPGAGEGQVFYLVKVDNAKFSKMVVPGDRLELDVELKRRIRNMAQYLSLIHI